MLKYHIQTIEVGSGGAASIDFTNIPQDYDDLYLVTSLRVASGTSYYWDVDLNVNGESARSWTGLYALGTSVGSNSSTAFNIIGGANGNATTGGSFSNIKTSIFNYTKTKVKTLSSEAVAENASTSQFFLAINSNKITNSAAVSTISLVVSGNTFSEHSSASLYGIKHGTSGDVEVASGGTISYSGGYTIHTFESSGTFVANRNLDVEYLVVAGGGGGSGIGSGTGTFSEGGGGAGGYRSSVSGESSGGGAPAESLFRVNSGNSYQVVIGAGGAAGGPVSNYNSTAGGNSSFGSILSVGGGNAIYFTDGATGGSGAGGGRGQLGGAGIANQGYAGGNGGPTTTSTSTSTGGGGGGAGGAGAVGTSTGAAGGAGVSSLITGASVTRAAGGEGGPTNIDRDGSTGTPNTGNGGGGGGISGGGSANGGNGGSGVVIIRYLTP